MRILAVEDDPRLLADLVAALSSAGFLVEEARDGEEAWFLGDTEDYALIMLDLGLPKMDGLSVLKRWRAAGREMPVIVLSARGTWQERVEGIDAGADDYLPKPFRMEEVVARVRALVRRSAGKSGSIHEIGSLSIDMNRMSVSLNGVPVTLTGLEYRALAYLALNQERAVSTSELREHLYGDDDAREANAVEALIARLRRKIGSEKITTRRGFGYAINCGAER
ncbi:response regulator transcription factor [Aquamicrobium zhengzhouense]|uniref:Response regulator transcription factor n=1 Tax=Aquamicrobium zhengzhouense TaxID=2781738 RepID=A0ABS0SD65_9HYPH|nr:response regulator transcription factor [Aquamicrobium zhengzhouense]MBI1621202.1 response regulator transcription factor [Aquamicrobium zhengzhouense]